MTDARFARRAPSAAAACGGLFLALSLLAGCVTDEPLGAGSSRTENPAAAPVLSMSDTLTDTSAPGAAAASLTGTWAVRQVNKNGTVYLGTLSLLQTGRLLVGRADWANHPDGHLLGYATANRVVFGQGFTDTSKANLLGFYAATLSADGDSLVQGLSVSSGLDSGVWVAARLSDCPVLPLTPELLPCQFGGPDTVITPPDTLPPPTPDPFTYGYGWCGTVMLPPDSLSIIPPEITPAPVVSDEPLEGCWRITQTGPGGTYTGNMILSVTNPPVVTGRLLWTNHPAGTLVGEVATLISIALPVPPPPPVHTITFVQSFEGAKADLKGHYSGKLGANGILAGTTYATQGGVPNGDSASWSASRMTCPGSP